MTILDETVRFGNGEPTTTEAAAVTCPNCSETVFTQTVGEVSCDDCGHDFLAQDHYGESCSAVQCADCGEAISFIQEHRCHLGDWAAYFCHHCSKILAIETAEGPQSLDQMLRTDWVLDNQEVDEVGTRFGDGYWTKRTQTDREQFATALLNSEAETNDSSFHGYQPGNIDAHLCFTEQHCIGYITWNWDSENPELGQIYLLPSFREQGIGSGFVEAWRNDVAGSEARFNVNNPNSNMYRLLRSIGAIELSEEDLEFPGCDITGHRIDLPAEWGEELENEG